MRSWNRCPVWVYEIPCTPPKLQCFFRSLGGHGRIILAVHFTIPKLRYGSRAIMGCVEHTVDKVKNTVFHSFSLRLNRPHLFLQDIHDINILAHDV
jgi:hypothetical protein